MGAISTGLFLSNEYVDTLTEKKIKQFIDNGQIRKSSATGQYELTEKGRSVFVQKTGESAVIDNKDGTKIKVVDTIDSIDLGKTMGFNKSSSPSAVTPAENRNTFGMTLFFDMLNINGEENTQLQQELTDAFKNIEGVNINENEISFIDNGIKNKLQQAIDQFQQKHSELYINNNNSKVAVNVKPEDIAYAEMMVKDGIFEKTDNGQYYLKNSTNITNYAKPVSAKTHTATLNGTVDSSKTIATNTEGLPKDNNAENLQVKLRDNKDARKEMETAAKKAYTNWVNVPENYDAVALYVASNRHGKQVEKRVKELAEGATHANGINADGKAYSISKEYNITGGEVFDLFIDRLPQKQKNELLDKVMGLANSDNPVINKKLQKVLKGTYEKINEETFNGPNGDAYKVEAAKLLFIEGLGLKPSDMLRLLAVNDVMGSRTPKEIEDDNKYFIEHQSKDYVRNMQAQQDNADTTVYFSKKARQAASKDENGINTDIGSRGRDLVRQAPQIFCDEVSEDEFKKAKGTDMAEEYFTSVITEQERDSNGKLTGKTITKSVYYKFSSQKYKDFMELACDPNAALDPANSAKLKNLNITLQEGRDGLELYIPDKDGHMIPIVNLLGNNNGRVGNNELNAWRNLAEKAGLSTDNNPTYLKRLADFAKKLGINGALFIGSAGLGNLVGGLLDMANSTLPQVLKSPDTYFTTSDRTITTPDKYVVTPTETMKIDGQTFNYNIKIDGVDYPITFQGADTYINVGGKTIKVKGDTITIKGETYKIEGKDVEAPGQSAGINLVKVAVATTAVTTIGWLLNDKANIHAKSRVNDSLYDPTIYVQESGQQDTSAQFRVSEYSNSVNLGQTLFGGYDADWVKMRQRGMDKEDYFNIDASDKAQPVICDMGNGNISVNSSSLKQPQTITMNDNSNGVTRNYTYQLLTPEEVNQEGLDSNKGPYYKLINVVNQTTGQSIYDGHKELKRLANVVINYTNTNDGLLSAEVEYQLEQDTGMAGAGQANGKPSDVQEWWDPSKKRTR